MEARQRRNTHSEKITFAIKPQHPGMLTWAARLSPGLLDASLPTPLYHQIYMVLRGLIQSGMFEAGAWVPAENTLAGLFAVSRITVKRALQELSEQQYVSRHRGRGTLITKRALIPVVRSSFDNLLASLQEMGLATEIELLDVTEVTAADVAVAKQMNVVPNAPLQRAVRRRKLEGEPLSYLITFTPKHIAARYTIKDLATTPFLTLLKRAGAAPLEAEQWITAVAAEPQVAVALDVAIAAPLLKIERIMRDANGVVIQLIQGFYRPDRFQYHVMNQSP